MIAGSSSRPIVCIPTKQNREVQQLEREEPVNLTEVHQLITDSEIWEVMSVWFEEIVR